jgi:ribosome biogenesis GTPase
VFRKSLGTYAVRSDGDTVQCAISSKLRKHLEYWFGNSDSPDVHVRVKKVHDIRELDPVAVGDRVRFLDAPDQAEQKGLIVEVLSRRNQLSRLAAGPKPLEQVMAANVDWVVPVFAARQPKPRWTLLDRYLASAESAGIPALICINKVDLLRDPGELDEIVVLYGGLGYRVLLTSTVTGEGIEAFAEAVRGCVSVFMGKSGVGKTSLLNALEPGLGLRVNEVRAVGKGRHTTSHLEMFPLEGGGGVIDMPGMREFGLWHDPSEGGLASLFVEMRPYIGTCRFGLDCSHTHEPDCAIVAAVAEGQISERRYRSYVRLSRR